MATQVKYHLKEVERFLEIIEKWEERRKKVQSMPNDEEWQAMIQIGLNYRQIKLIAAALKTLCMGNMVYYGVRDSSALRHPLKDPGAQ